ncbi:MAG: hypothetical protein ACK47B_15350 [Armatimonadota bacterium]
MRSWISTLAGCLTAAALLVSSLAAAPAVETNTTDEGTRLTVGGKLIAYFRTPNGTTSPERRAEIAAERLRTMIPDGLTAAAINLRARGADWGVYAGDQLLMIATADEAEARKISAKETAERWAGNLKAALPAGSAAKQVAAAAPAAGKPAASKKAAAPKPAPSGPTSTQVTVPVGESRTVEIGGATGSEVTVDIDQADVVDVLQVEGKQALEVRGLNPGKAVVTVSVGGKSAKLVCWVKKWAGRIVAPPQAAVTGDLAPGSFVKKVAVERVLEAVEREPGTVVRVTGEPEGVRALAAGQSATVSFPVTISGEGFLPVTAKAQVRVENSPLPYQRTDLLLYSNDPESVREYGTLFEGLIEPNGPGRLLFHHQNRMGRPFHFQVHVINPSDEPVDVQIIEGVSGPFIDTIQVGHRAGERYLANAKRDLGYVTRVPARGSRSLFAAKVEKLLTVSGIYGIRIVRGGPLVVQVSVSADASRPALRGDLVAAARNEPHSYPSPDKYLEHKYEVGSKYWTFIPMGREPITGKSPRRKLLGNYGVVYDITLNLSNPTDQMGTVKVLLSAQAGWTRGVFMIDGKLVEAPQIAPPAESELISIQLPPGARKKINIQGIPVSGSAYPVSLIVRS